MDWCNPSCVIHSVGASGGISETVCIIEFFQEHFIAYLHPCFHSKKKGKSELEGKEGSDKFSLRDLKLFFLYLYCLGV